MRGKVAHAGGTAHIRGITPAHAGKSDHNLRDGGRLWDHPRTCGEKEHQIVRGIDEVGSPPHMRGKGGLVLILIVRVRITPAHAGKSTLLPVALVSATDHPRTCGEKSPKRAETKLVRGSPPHMRGKAPEAEVTVRERGITPAHAGKSPSPDC